MALVVRRYVKFMTTPGSHNDTYAGTCHRMFFANWKAGVPRPLTPALPLQPAFAACRCGAPHPSQHTLPFREVRLAPSSPFCCSSEDRHISFAGLPPQDCPDNDGHNVDTIDGLVGLIPVIVAAAGVSARLCLGLHGCLRVYLCPCLCLRQWLHFRSRPLRFVVAQTVHTPPVHSSQGPRILRTSSAQTFWRPSVSTVVLGMLLLSMRVFHLFHFVVLWCRR